jgi:hypothetical protein
MSTEQTQELPTLELPVVHDDELDDEWPTAGPPRGLRLRAPAAALAALLLVALGFWGGATLKRSSAAPAAGGRNFAAFAAGRGGAAGGAAATGGFGGTQAAATGTVSVVAGNTLYVLTGTGSLVKVQLDPSTSITRDAKTQANALRPGDTVVVQGSTASDGNVTASSVAATAPGSGTTGAGGGGFGGRGGFGGGATSSTTPSGGSNG